MLLIEHASSRGVLEGGGATGLLNKGGGSNRLPGLVTKQQAVEFPQVLASRVILHIHSHVYKQINTQILIFTPTNIHIPFSLLPLSYH